MMKKARAVQFGCGPIGCSVVKCVYQRADIEVVGAVDIDKSLAGRTLEEFKKLG
jgi:hypothetical protein